MSKIRLNQRRTKGDKIRHARKTAKDMKRNSSVYRRIRNWEESTVEDNTIYSIELCSGWSFSTGEYSPTASFTTLEAAMRAVHKTVPMSPESVETKSEDISEKSWHERLDELTKIK